MRKFNAFTLAEVLITLGIIGVVAAMTMPTLINQTNGAQYKAAYKKALSAISQGVTLNVALDDISFADTVKGGAGADSVTAAAGETGTTVAGLLNSRMNIVNKTGAPEKYSPTLPKITVCKEVTDPETSAKSRPTSCNDTDKEEINFVTPDTYLFFNDSSMLAFASSDTFKCTQISNATNGNKICQGVIDVNGIKGPNKAVVCDGSSTGSSCEVKSPTDIYPVIFYDQTILPASDAAKAVLYGK